MTSNSDVKGQRSKVTNVTFLGAFLGPSSDLGHRSTRSEASTAPLLLDHSRRVPSPYQLESNRKISDRGIEEPFNKFCILTFCIFTLPAYNSRITGAHTCSWSLILLSGRFGVFWCLCACFFFRFVKRYFFSISLFLVASN